MLFRSGDGAVWSLSHVVAAEEAAEISAAAEGGIEGESVPAENSVAVGVGGVGGVGVGGGSMGEGDVGSLGGEVGAIGVEKRGRLMGVIGGADEGDDSVEEKVG